MRKNLLYSQVDCLYEQRKAAIASLQLWHEGFVHNNKIDARSLAKAVVDMKLLDEGDEPCDVCNRKSKTITDQTPGTN